MAIAVKLPELGENIEEAKVGELYISEGDEVDEDQDLMKLESDKASMDLPATSKGTIEKIHVSTGDTVHVGDVLLEIKSASDEKSSEPDHGEETREREGSKEQDDASASDETEDDESDKTDSDEADAEEKDDTDASASDEGKTSRKPREKAEQTQDIAGEHAKYGPVRKRRQTHIERSMAENMTRAWREIPHVTHHDMADITALEEVRKKLNLQAEQAGHGDAHITITTILLRLLGALLKEYPDLNASYDKDHREVILKQYVHIGLAVDTNNGLLVPVIRNVDELSLWELERTARQKAAAARDGKLDASDFRGGSFTVTNVGSMGGRFFTPIINYPQVAILGIARLREDGGRLHLPLSLSYDHRVVDGATAARFVSHVVGDLEEPARFIGDI